MKACLKRFKVVKNASCISASLDLSFYRILHFHRIQKNKSVLLENIFVPILIETKFSVNVPLYASLGELLFSFNNK
jgi:hypothetical protein